MPIDWSDQIVIAELADEPAFSEELQAIEDRLARDASGSTPHVVLNLAPVTHLNSTNLAQLLRLRATLTERGRRLSVCCLGDDVWSIMLVTGLDKVFEFAPDTASAIASLQIDDAGGEAG